MAKTNTNEERQAIIASALISLSETLKQSGHFQDASITVLIASIDPKDEGLVVFSMMSNDMTNLDASLQAALRAAKRGPVASMPNRRM